MKVRLGVLSGTPGSGAGVDGAGAYFSLDGTREGVVGLHSIHYCVKGGETEKTAKTVQIWPGEGLYRITSIRLQLPDNLAENISRMGRATQNFAVKSHLRLHIGNRLWRLDSSRADIRWDANTHTIFFLNNTGPFADVILRGDYVTLEAAMEARTSCYEPPAGKPYSSLTKVATFQPYTTCNIYVGADWNGNEQCAAGVMKMDGQWLVKAQGVTASSAGKKGGSSQNIGQEEACKGVAGGPYTIWLLGYKGHAQVRVTMPAGSCSVTAKVLEINIQS